MKEKIMDGCTCVDIFAHWCNHQPRIWKLRHTDQLKLCIFTTPDELQDRFYKRELRCKMTILQSYGNALSKFLCTTRCLDIEFLFAYSSHVEIFHVIRPYLLHRYLRMLPEL